MNDRQFTPALGHSRFNFQYDFLVALLTRERRWRGEAIRQLAVQPDDVIVDVGCGTGSLAILIKQQHTSVTMIGVDPDATILDIARKKSQAVDADIIFRTAMGDVLVDTVGAETVDKVVSSLVLHQCPLPMKRAILADMFKVLRRGGKLVIADYGWQRTAAMRLGFRLVQMADGKEDTQPNADGIVPTLMREAGFSDVTEAAMISTLSGSISIYTAARPQ